MIPKTTSVLHRSLVGFVGIACFAAAGCGGASGTTAGDSGGPVAQKPLSGTIGSASFTAMSAFAGSASGTGRSVTIWGKAGDCANMPVLADGENQILLSVDPWQSGTAYQLSFDFSNLAAAKTVTFVTGPSTNDVATVGRVELVTAASAGTMGLLRLRASSGTKGSVEGQIAVTACN